MCTISMLTHYVQQCTGNVQKSTMSRAWPFSFDLLRYLSNEQLHLFQIGQRADVWHSGLPEQLK